MNQELDIGERRSTSARTTIKRGVAKAVADNRGREPVAWLARHIVSHPATVPQVDNAIYTHVVDASHRAAVTAVEERLFGAMLRNAPKSAAALENAAPASNCVN